MNPEQALVYFTDLKRSYQAAFSNQIVRDDLERFCFAERSTIIVPGEGAPVDLNRTMAAQGRREYYLRVKAFLERSPEELVAMFTTPLEGDKAK